MSSALFSDRPDSHIHSIGDVLQTVKALNLRQYDYGRIRREEKLGEGETFIVHKCGLRNPDGRELWLAIKHLKISSSPDDSTYLRRLKSVILELRIMRHLPLRSHPSITEVFGYGWHRSNGDPTEDSSRAQHQIMPYLLVPYATHGTFRDYLRSASSEISLQSKEILLGDIASALTSLHLCGIVHGDVKLDNVLIFISWDRPSATIAKLTDFGHSIVIGNDYQSGSKDSPRYTGTPP